MINNGVLNSPRNLKIIFFVIFILSFLFLGLRWKIYIMTDSSMWGSQAQYVLNGDHREFDYLQAYGHPGGTIIEGSVIIHKLFDINYEKSVLLFVAFLCSIFIAGICLLCILLNKNKLWFISVFPFLVFNWKYVYGTPPSVISSILVTFLCLLTLYIYEEKAESQNIPIVLWVVTAGLSIATRADIGVFSFFVFIFLLSRKLNWKKIGLICLGSFAAFSIFDPFMWFMPIQHIKDLIFKLVYHYAEFNQTHINLFNLITVSSFVFISIIISAFFLIPKKENNLSPIPILFLWTLIIMTFCLYFIFLSSRYQAERYFLPIIFIWEVFFPLLFFSLLDKFDSKYIVLFKILIIILLFVYNIDLVGNNIWVCNPYCL